MYVRYNMRLFNRLLDYIDMKKKEKALKQFPFSYEDRHGKKWFNTDYCCGYCRLRKWC